MVADGDKPLVARLCSSPLEQTDVHHRFVHVIDHENCTCSSEVRASMLRDAHLRPFIRAA